ncbi:MAG TPA: hypothetical protein VMD58_07915 [Acidobacteriaceae bacterium]|nr:hypothetical protein [Acidobacteriaceae bacterium]
MLKIIEYSLLAVSLLVVIGLIVSGSRSTSDASTAQNNALPKEDSEAHEPGKSV